MHDPKHATIVGKDGLTGVLLDPLPTRPAPGAAVRVRLAGGDVVDVPADSVVLGSDGTYLIPYGASDLTGPARTREAGPVDQEGVIPVLAEELVVGRKPVQTGGVRVTRRVLEHDETVEIPLVKERVDVRRVLVDREVEGPLPTRREGDTTIIPIVEEEVIIQKRYRLKEEVHVTRIVSEEVHRERVTVRRQEPEIERMDADGRVRTTAPRAVPEPAAPAPARRKRRSILGED
jgi:uncharacterized protein (TIGR02271 family)